MQELELLQQKLSKLIQSYQELKAAHARLQSEFFKQEKTNQLQAEHIALLEQEKEDNWLEVTLQHTDIIEKASLKTYLEAIIHQIDEHIKLLKV